MDLIPVPELVGAAALSLLILGVRAGLRVWRTRSVPAGADDRISQDTLSDTERVRVRLIASCLIFAIISVPLVLRLVPPNGSYGFRTHATRSSPAVWYAANAFMGWAMLISSAICVAVLAALPPTTQRWLLWTTFLLSVVASIVASSAYVAQLQ
jgi:hypothetical protein